jgi:hypothetical protein
MINRRFMIVPPALPSGGHAEQFDTNGQKFSRLQLETANMREWIESDGWHPPGKRLGADCGRSVWTRLSDFHH